MKLRQKAFTLIELLVVIGIIAVLAGLLIPVVTKMQIQSRNLKCTSNLRQIGAALLAFTGDHNGLFPTAGATVLYHQTDPTTELPGWTEQLEPYIGTDRSIFICPSSSTLLVKNVQYSYFLGCRAAMVANHTFSPVRFSLLAAPSKYILSGDVVSDSLFPDQGALDADKDDYSQNPGFATMTKIFHGKKTNLVFADGHVGAFTSFDRNAMTVRYGLREDGTGYDYSDPVDSQ